MKIYLNGNEISANVLSSENAVLDETLDTFSFFFLNDDPTPIEPMTSVVVEENGSVRNYVVTADDAERFSLVKEIYKHSLSCTENTRKLSKYLVRNSVFSQPKERFKTFYSNFAWSEYELTIDGDDRYYGFHTMNTFGSLRLASPQRVNLTAREKVARAFLELSLQVAVSEANNGTGNQDAVSHNDLRNMGEVLALIDNASPNMSYNDMVLHYDLGGETHNEIISVANFNEEEEAPYIAQLINQGATNLYIDLDGNQFFTNATQHTGGKHIPFYSLQIKLRLEVYWYSAYDILELLLQRHRKTHTVGGGEISNADPYVLPSSGELYELLNNTIAPDFTFTQCTLYEAVADVFRLFDAIFTMDGNNVLGIVYFNDRGDEIAPKLTGLASALGEERYNNGLVSFYQDARTEEHFPQGDNYAPARTAEIGIPDKGDHCFVLPHEIQAINKVVLNCTLKAGGVVSIDPLSGLPSQFTTIYVSNYPLDITHNVVEKSIWSSYLPTTDKLQYADNYLLRQNNTIYYTKGDNKIEIAYSLKTAWGYTYYAFGAALASSTMRQLGLEAQFTNSTNPFPYCFYEPSSPNCNLPSWNEVKMRVEYLTSVNGKLKIESVTDKYEGEMLIDQSNGAVDLNKLGLNILGLSLKMGEPTLNASIRVTTWEDRVKPGQTIAYQGATWVANSCNYLSLGNGYFKGSVAFVKNYNELSLRKSILREKRLTNISAELTQKSEETLVEYCYFSTSHAPAQEVCSFDAEVFNYCIANSFGVDTPIKSLDYGVIEGTNPEAPYIYLPTIRYGAGNMVCFEMSFDNPIVAGIMTDESPDDKDPDPATHSWFGTQVYYSSYVAYADEDGFMGKCSVSYCFNAKGDFDATFPKVSYPNRAFLIEDFEFHKQPNEVFALNYEIAFLPLDQAKDFVGSAFINENFLVSGKTRKRKLCVYQGEEPYSVLDTMGKGTRYEITDITHSSGEIVITHNAGGDTEHWAICDERGKILFASNSPAVGYEKRLYFALRNSRI